MGGLILGKRLFTILRKEEESSNGEEKGYKKKGGSFSEGGFLSERARRLGRNTWRKKKGAEIHQGLFFPGRKSDRSPECREKKATEPFSREEHLDLSRGKEEKIGRGGRKFCW